MDEQRFDNLSRIIARSTSRRATVKGIAAAIGGGVFAGVFGVRAQRAGAQGTGQPGDACDASDQCASGNCSGINGRSGVCYCVDPDRPWVGCSCEEGTEGPCGGGMICCPNNESPGGSGVCVPDSVSCNPTGECSAQPGDTCETNNDCCTGSCMSGICACLDASRPWLGCGCDTGSEIPCGDNASLVCCPTTTTPGGPGTCTAASVGCEAVCSSYPGEECASSDDCCVGSCFSGICACTPGLGWEGCDCTVNGEGQCGAPTTLVCCQKGDAPAGDGVCTSGMTGCQVVCNADPGDECASNADCCLGTCMSGICACEDPSRPDVGCPCQVGDAGACGGRAELCCNIGQEPGSAGSCISPMAGICNPTGHCLADPGETCMVDSDCCEGKCSDDHVCYCADPAEPLRNCSCHSGTEHPCGDDTLLCCDTDGIPGGDGICIPDRLGCASVGHCAVKGDACLHDDDCCDKLACHDKKCGPKHHGPKPTPTTPVTTLPSTGSGSDGGSDLGAWLGVTAVAGAAAILAGRKLNQKPAEGTDEA